MSHASHNSSIHPPPRQSPSRGKPSCWTRSPAPTTLRHRQKGPLLRCQDNATAAIVKSQGYCVVDFSAGLRGPSHYSRHTPAQIHTKTTEKCDRIGRFYSCEEAAQRRKKKKKKRDGTEEGTKEERFKKHFWTDQRRRRKEKHVCKEKKNK